MAMNIPVHPGAIVREDCLRPLGLSVTEGARRLGIGRHTLSNLVNERTSVSIPPEPPIQLNVRSHPAPDAPDGSAIENVPLRNSLSDSELPQ